MSGEWPPKEYAEARAFLYNLGGEAFVPLISDIDGSLHPSVVNTNGVLLSSNQVEGMVRAIKEKSDRGTGINFCAMQPRHGVVFYDSSHQPVGWLEVCFQCNIYRLSAGKSDNLLVNWTSLKQAFIEAGLPVLENANEYDELAVKLKRLEVRNIQYERGQISAEVVR